MKYCIRHYNNAEAIAAADEIMIDCEKVTGKMLDTILSLVKTKDRVIVNLLPYLDTNYQVFADLAIKADNIVFLINHKRHDVDFFQNNKMKFFFDAHINTPEKLRLAIDAGVTDVYITDDFGFELIKIAETCKSKGVKIRCYPNIAQTEIAKRDVNSFFIRPEDIGFYENYVDVAEFFCPLDRQKILLEIYKEGKWEGPLGQIISELSSDVPNESIPPHFVTARLTCNKRCNFINCTICKETTEIARTFKEYGIAIQTKIGADNSGV